VRIEAIRITFANRLRNRRAEIEREALARIHSVSDSVEASDPEYLDGLKASVAAALEYGIEALVRTNDRFPPIPTTLLSQARLAARHGVNLDTVLRRYLAGHTLLGDFIIDESELDGLDNPSLKRMLRRLSTALDRLIATVSEEYAREAGRRPASTKQRLAERVERLLAGGLLDAAEFSYDFDAYHLGVVAAGPGAREALGDLVKGLDLRQLLVEREDTVWLWLGSRERFDAAELTHRIPEGWPSQVSLAIGESANGLAGWRQTHRQARAALAIARAGPCHWARYADVALLASLLQDELLAVSLRQLYLTPLSTDRDGGDVSRETLRAYFSAEQNVTSAAAALGVNRNTVASRLRAIEAKIGRPLGMCGAELIVALRLDALTPLPD
jgi:DNA-binding PucR family transcriptional regulator